MTTIKLAVLRHTRAKDGSYKILSLLGKSETHYIVTKYKVNQPCEFVNGVVVGQPDAKPSTSNCDKCSPTMTSDWRIPNAGDMTRNCNLLRDMPSHLTVTPQTDCGHLLP